MKRNTSWEIENKKELFYSSSSSSGETVEKCYMCRLGAGFGIPSLLWEF